MSAKPGKSGILGASGFLGAHLVRYFRERGWDAVAIGKEAGDLSDPGNCERAFKKFAGVERIFHVVTHQRTGNRQYEIPAELLAINARVHLNVLAAWAKHAPQAKLISTGSSCVYPEVEDPIPEALYQTGPLHKSVRGYGLAKMLLATGSQLYAEQYGLHYLHCILATLYGPDDHLEQDRSHFIGAMLLRAMTEQRRREPKFIVWGAPDTVRDCLYVTDQIEAILAAQAHFQDRILNCSSGVPVTVGQVAETILKVLDWRVPVEYPAGTFRGTARKTLDSAEFLRATGWTPQVPLERGLALTAESLRAAIPG